MNDTEENTERNKSAGWLDTITSMASGVKQLANTAQKNERSVRQIWAAGQALQRFTREGVKPKAQYIWAFYALIVLLVCVVISFTKAAFTVLSVLIVHHKSLMTVACISLVMIKVIFSYRTRIVIAYYNRVALTILISQASFLAWSFLTLLTLQSYASRGSIWEMMALAVTYGIGVTSRAVIDRTTCDDEKHSIRHNASVVILVITSLASLSHILRLMTMSDETSYLTMIWTTVDISKLVATKILLATLLWFKTLGTSEKITDITQSILFWWNTMMSNSIFLWYWDISKPSALPTNGMTEFFLRFRNVLGVAVAELDDDSHVLRRRTMTFGTYVTFDGYRTLVIATRAMVWTLLTIAIISRVSIFDPRVLLVIALLATNIFYNLGRPIIPNYAVQIVRNRNYVDAVALATMTAKVRNACICGTLEDLTPAEQDAARRQIHERLSRRRWQRKSCG